MRKPPITTEHEEMRPIDKPKTTKDLNATAETKKTTHNTRTRRNETHRQAENNQGSECNCRNKENCPLDGKCNTRSIICKATVVSGEEEREYIGLTENAFKQRYANQKSTFRHEKNEKSTELAKHVWKLKRRNEQYQI